MLASTDLLTNISSAPEQYLIKKNHIQLKDQFLTILLRELTGPPSFVRQTRQSLQNLCKHHGVRGFSRMTKEGMVEALKSKGAAVPPIPLQALTKSELIAAIESKLYSDCHGDG